MICICMKLVDILEVRHNAAHTHTHMHVHSILISIITVKYLTFLVCHWEARAASLRWLHLVLQIKRQWGNNFSASSHSSTNLIICPHSDWLSVADGKLIGYFLFTCYITTAVREVPLNHIGHNCNLEVFGAQMSVLSSIFAKTHCYLKLKSNAQKSTSWIERLAWTSFFLL